MGSSDSFSSPADAMKRSITVVLILFIVVIIYFSGPSTAFYMTSNPSIAHKPGTKDFNVSITFYKERYEAIGTISARMIALPINPTTTGPNSDITRMNDNPTTLLSAKSNTDVNCWAAPYAAPATGQLNQSFYSYALDAYYTPGAPSGPFAAGTLMDQNFNIFAYGYMWNPWYNLNTGATNATALRFPGDVNFVYKFLDWSSDLGFSYTSGEAGAVQFGYYGYGYNYAGKFTCVFKFTSMGEGLYVGIVPYINGIAVDTTGYNRLGLPARGTSNETGSVFAIKDVNTQSAATCPGGTTTQCTTDMNFVDPTGTKRLSFTVPRASTDANSSISFITVDINADGVSNPTNADMNIGKGASGPPRFTFAAGDTSGNPLPAFVLSSAATLNLFYTGFITGAEEATMISRLKIFTLKNGTWTKLSPTFSDADGTTDLNRMTVTITEFI